MKQIILSFFTAAFLLFSSNIIIAQTPQLTVDGKTNNGVVLQKLQVEIKVGGTVAKTTWVMVFKNNTDKVLEGTLNFPLKDRCSVSRYGLDINGKIREAVPVDRGKGTLVFEAIERRRVDPGLLEKVEGNTFRTRIYPINAHSTRTVMIGYEEELPFSNDDRLRYYLPLNLQDTIADFSLNIAVLQSLTQPVFDTVLSTELNFDQQKNVYTAALHRLNFVPQHSLSFSIKKPADATEIMLQEFENKYYYLINTRLEKPDQEKPLPKNVTLLWDASLSGANRDIKKELVLLDAYFKKINNASVDLLVFSNKIQSSKKYTLQNGDWHELKNAVDSIQYDGATNFGCLNLNKLQADEFLLLSDGRQTLSATDMRLGSIPVYCINSAARADYSALKFIALKTGGAVIDLQTDGIAAALDKLTIVPLRFMGIQQNQLIEEGYPSLRVAVGNNFSAAGIASIELKEIVLLFGYGDKVMLTKKIIVQPDSQLCEGFDITKIFGQKKIAELDIQYELNKQAIENTGKQFGIITRNTSLIVLETVNDYLQYNIEPPAELRAEYDRIIKQRGKEITQKKEEDLRTSLEMMSNLKTWWRTVKKIIPPVVKPAPAPLPPNPPAIANTNANRGSAALDPHPTGIVKTITGRVSLIGNSAGVPGASIKIKGRQPATISDRNGNYSLLAQQGDVLQFSAIGYITTECRVPASARLNVSMNAANQSLQEVVVTGYGVQRKREITGSVTTVSADNISMAIREQPLQQLEGRLAGVEISNSAPSVDNRIRIRGVTTNTTAAAPMYIIDGRAGDISDISDDQIKNVNVLTGNSATAIYGTSAAKGVVIITTKDGDKNISDTIVPAAIDIRLNTATTDYLKIIKATPRAERYTKYLQLRTAYISNPVYFFEVASYFIKTGDKETGLKILSNLAELESGSYELYKMLGYKLKESGDYENETIAFKKIIELRPLDPQSYRDYALALEDEGKYQEAMDALYRGMTTGYSEAMQDIYEGIEEIFLAEINRIAALHNKNLKLQYIPKQLLQPMPVDLRVVMNWNMNNTDIDLWITDPNGEKCFYSHPATAMGGRISNDFTQGFGPEQFMLKQAAKGKYRIEINYYGDSQATLAGPTTVMAEIYTHYGMPNEERKIITLQMEKGKSGAVFIGEVSL